MPHYARGKLNRCAISSRNPAPSGSSVTYAGFEPSSSHHILTFATPTDDGNPPNIGASLSASQANTDGDRRPEPPPRTCHTTVRHADRLSKCGGPKLTCTLERTAVNPALRSSWATSSASSRVSETSSFQSIARSTSRYFESFDSRAPGTLVITSTAASFIRRRHSGRLACGTP